MARSSQPSQVDPANPQNVTSFHAQEVGLSVDEPHFRLGYLDPPPGWETLAPVGDLTDSAGVSITGKGGKILKNYDMPRYLSSDISVHRIEAYFRLHPKFSYDDIEARQPSWCRPLNRHAFSNERLRKGRRPFNARCFVRTCNYPTKVDVELVESLSVLQIMVNTGWVITSRGIQDPKNPNRFYPLDQFLHGERWHTPSVVVAEALAESHRLKALAATHRKSHWRELPQPLLPREWYQRTKGAKAGRISRDAGVQQDNGLTTGGSRSIKRKPATAELDAEDDAQPNAQSAKRLRLTSGLGTSGQTKARTTTSKRMRIRDNTEDEVESEDDGEEEEVSVRPLKRVRTRANAAAGVVGVANAEYQGPRLSKSNGEHEEIARSGRQTRSSKPRNTTDFGLGSNDVTATANRLSFGGRPSPYDQAHQEVLEPRTRVNNTAHGRGYEAGNQTSLRGALPFSSQYPDLDEYALSRPVNPYYAMGYRPSTGPVNSYYEMGYRPPTTRGETSSGRQADVEAERSSSPTGSAFSYGAQSREKALDETPDHGHTRSGQSTHNTSGVTNTQGTMNVPSSNPVPRRGAALDLQPLDPQLFAPHLIDPQLLDPQLRNPIPSHAQQQPQGPSNPPSNVVPASTRSHEVDPAARRSLDSQLASLDSGPSAGQPTLSDAMVGGSSWRIAAVPPTGITSPPAALQEIQSNPQELAMDSPALALNSQEPAFDLTPQPGQLEDHPAQDITNYAQSQVPHPSQEDSFFDELIHSYDSYEGEDVPADSDTNVWRPHDE